MLSLAFIIFKILVQRYCFSANNYCPLTPFNSFNSINSPFFATFASLLAMNIQELSKQYARRPQVKALATEIGKNCDKPIFLEGLMASSAPLLFSSLAEKLSKTILFVLQDAEEAGYFYHDLTQLMDTQRVLFFPSSYKRSVKYAQRDPANEILRTETLAAIAASASGEQAPLYIVSYPEAVAEMVVTKKRLDSRTLTLTTGQTVSTTTIEQTLQDFGFREVDYVYEPGQYALRGSILDVYSFSSEYPFRIDFFGDEIDSVRTFEVEDQLSKERRERVDIVPELSGLTEDKESLLKFLTDDTLLCMKDYDFIADAIDRTYQEGFSQQAIQERIAAAETEMEQHDIEQQLRRECQLINGAQFRADSERFRRIELRGKRSEGRGERILHFNISPQPLFHKNFDLLAKTLEDYLLQGFQLFILADSRKQQERLKEILSPLLAFIPVDKTLHEGFIDVDARACFFTDHQIFDRFHKYNLKSDKARTGKVALTLKEIQQFEIGDYVVHVDHGIGKFGGLVRMPVTSPKGGGQEGAYQEMIKITYQRGDSIYVPTGLCRASTAGAPLHRPATCTSTPCTANGWRRRWHRHAGR